MNLSFCQSGRFCLNAGRLHRRLILLTVVFRILVGSAMAADIAAVTTIESLEVQPEQIVLIGNRSQQQLLVTANPSSPAVFDATADASFTIDNPSVAQVIDGILTPTGNGRTVLHVEFGNRQRALPVMVSDFETPQPVAFQTEVLAALTKAGCNMGACHGSPSGKGGFRLSLRGYDPKLDLMTLRAELFNRRTDTLDPDHSLLLQKPLMEVSHGGGHRLTRGSAPHVVLRQWIGEGMQRTSPHSATLDHIEVIPPIRVIANSTDRQQLIVNGYFSDGTVRDITPLTAFDSSNEDVATVADSGVVTRTGRGEVTILARYLEKMDTSLVTFHLTRPEFEWPQIPIENEIDQLVFDKLRRLQIAPSAECTDAEFLRRATLDLTGRLPTLEEIGRFESAPPDSRRTALIDRLLASEDYATFWSMKWGDLLRCNSKRLTAPGVHKFRRWLFASVRDDQPVSEFAFDLLTSTGSVQTNPAANYWRACEDEIEATETTAQLFMGIRIQCAKCHNHPFERWTQDDYYGIAAAFRRVGRKEGFVPDEQIVFVDDAGEVTQPRTGETMKVRLLSQGEVDVPEGTDRRRVFADWLIDDNNPFFARSVANRIWGHLMGRGIVEPVDDFRDSNPPSNPELLNWLAAELRRGNYSAKHLVRTIMNSRVYQLSSEPGPFNENDAMYFSRYTTRMLTAEQLLDGVCFVTGVAETFRGMPEGIRAIDLVDPPKEHRFLQAFGMPARELPCECERSTDSNLAQALQLINGATVHDKIRADDGSLHGWISDGMSDAEIIRSLYLKAISRPPSESELNASIAHTASAEDRTQALEDIAWAVINSREFMFQH